MDRSADRRGDRIRRYCHQCRPPAQPANPAAYEVRLDGLLAEPDLTPTHRAVLIQAASAAETAGWSAPAVGSMLTGLHRILGEHAAEEPLRLSQVRAELRSPKASRLARSVLDDLGLLVDDTVPAIRSWIDRQCDALPAGYRDEVRAWLVELLDGGDRVRPRSTSTLYVYYGRVRPHLLTWSTTREQLREITENDVTDVLNAQRGHQRAGTFTALRSLFRFAKRRRLIFADPTRQISVGAAPKRALVPMTDAEIGAVKRTAVTPMQRLVVALAAVHAARAAAIRALTLDDLDLGGRRVRLGGRTRRLAEFVHQALVDWLAERHRKWPHTPNRHVLVSDVTAAGTEPVSDYYLTWHLLFQGVQLEHIRGDRILQEALAVDADPLHLVTAFNLSMQTAIDYSQVARQILERPIENTAESDVAPSTSTPHGGTDNAP